MSEWNHPICQECWDRAFPARTPSQIALALRELETCCNCGQSAREGIYVRLDPVEVPNHSKHRQDA